MNDIYGVLMMVLLVALGFFLSLSCRADRIEACEERGGQPITPAWFTDEPHDVRCVEPTP